MKKILNWTFGGFFRAFGRILCFLVIGTIVGYLLMSNDFKIPDILSFGLMRVKADTVNYNYKQYRVQYYSLSDGTTAWTSWTNFATSTTLSSGYGVQTTAVRLGSSTDFASGNTYRVVIDLGISPSSEKQYVQYNSSSCYGSTSTSSWSNTEITDCQYIGLNDTPNSVHRKVIFDITPQSNFKGLQFNIGWSGTAEIGSINVYNTTSITTGPDITGAIDEQTIVIQDGFEDITNKITEVNENLINAITENNTVCELVTINNTITFERTGCIIGSSGNISCSSTYSNNAVTKYYELSEGSEIKAFRNYSVCSSAFYDSNGGFISSFRGTSNNTSGVSVTIPTNAKYVRFCIGKNQNYDFYTVKSCKKSGDAITDALHGLGSGIHDNDTTEATNEASSFFSNFTTNTHGLTSIITAPLNAITSLNSATCTPLHIPIPFLTDSYIDLPCMRPIYEDHFGSFISLYDVITFGIVAYWVLVRIFNLVKDFKNPEHDEIEVVDL